MKTKKAVCIALAGALAFPLAACDKGDGKFTVSVYMPDGAPAVAMSAMMDAGYADTDFTVVTAAMIEGVTANKTADMAILPINTAAKLFNGGAAITMLSVNTHGNMYLLGRTEETIAPADLVGKVVGSIGQGQVPDLTLKMMLDECGAAFEVGKTEAVAGKVAIRYPGANEALPALLKQGAIDYAFLPEPAVSTAIGKFGFHIVMDAQAQWESLFGGAYPQACLVAQNSLVEDHSDYIDAFLAELKKTESAKWAENNPEKAVAAVKAHFIDGSSSTLETLSAQSIARCNFATVDAVDAYDTCAEYFAKLVNMSTGLGTTVISSAPSDAFYYKK